jgi:hypothetical protein
LQLLEGSADCRTESALDGRRADQVVAKISASNASKGSLRSLVLPEFDVAHALTTRPVVQEGGV